jgi:hypothetical protein
MRTRHAGAQTGHRDHYFDEGVDHSHDWAMHSAIDRSAYPICHQASEARTPSSAFHDDAHYA